ncbi:MAG: B12-binding domain-containing radical SAM protein [Elusimicrobia bacterium]|nr:B12-binding domain-containing radical SAM protein [Elusimicrobiota bacterium]
MNKEKLVLINPPMSRKARYGAFASLGGIEPPHGLCYLAAAVKRLGLPVEIIDAQALNMDVSEIIRAIERADPSVIGLTAVTASIRKAAEIARCIKTANPGITTIIGGIHLSGLPAKTMDMFPQFDIGIIGEGEITLTEIFGRRLENKSHEDVRGIIYRENGRLVNTGRRDYIEDLDSLPMPAYHLLPRLDRYYYLPTQNSAEASSISIMTSRGCPYGCYFCDHSVFGSRLRRHGNPYIISLLEHLKAAYGIKDVFFQDDTFFADENRIRELLAMMIDSGLNIKWSCHVRPGMSISGDTLRMMKLAGCWRMNIGIESGSQKVLERLGKRIDFAKTETALKLYRSCGFNIKGLFMVGNPAENDDTIAETIDIMRRLPLDDISLAYFTPYPGTEIYKNISAYGTLEEKWEQMTSYEVLFLPAGMTADVLKSAFKRLLRGFYIRPRIILGYLGRIDSPARLMNLVRGAGLLLQRPS